MIQDIWGNWHSADDVELILTRSMFKGFGWMMENGISWSEYLRRCLQYDHVKIELTPSILNTGNLNSELMRIAYVAMTRPRKLLVVSLPKSYNKLSRMPQSLWEYREI